MRVARWGHLSKARGLYGRKAGDSYQLRKISHTANRRRGGVRKRCSSVAWRRSSKNADLIWKGRGPTRDSQTLATRAIRSQAKGWVARSCMRALAQAFEVDSNPQDQPWNSAAVSGSSETSRVNVRHTQQQPQTTDSVPRLRLVS